MSQISRSQPGEMNIDQMINMAYNLCTVVTMPIEVIIRPLYGTRYFHPLAAFLSAMLMIFLPVFASLLGGVGSMLTFGLGRAPQAPIGLSDLSRLYFFLIFIHGIRLFRRMTHMHLETNSVYEGPGLPILNWLPFAKSFWTQRILIEPALIFAIAIICGNMFLFQPGLSNYLCFAAFLLAMKNYIAWYTEWEFLRKLMDMQNAGPIISRMVRNEATHEELATIHVAAFPKDLPDDIRQEAVGHIAKVYDLTPAGN